MLAGTISWITIWCLPGGIHLMDWARPKLSGCGAIRKTGARIKWMFATEKARAKMG
jgi:hypothetical protein